MTKKDRMTLSIVAQLLYDLSMDVTFDMRAGVETEYLSGALNYIEERFNQANLDGSDKENFQVLYQDLRRTLCPYDAAQFLEKNVALVKYIDFITDN